VTETRKRLAFDAVTLFALVIGGQLMSRRFEAELTAAQDGDAEKHVSSVQDRTAIKTGQAANTRRLDALEAAVASLRAEVRALRVKPPASPESEAPPCH
jgi:hypothetical protein